MKTFITMCALSVLVAADANADTADVPISQTVSEPKSGFPAAVRPDVTGISIGMDATQVRQAFASERPEIQSEVHVPTDAQPGAILADGYHTSERKMVFAMSEPPFSVNFSEALVSMASVGAEVVYDPSKGGTFERAVPNSISVAFGSGFTGGKAQIIYSLRQFAEPVDTESISAAVAEKYGEPSAVENDKKYVAYHYAYRDGAKMEGADEGLITSCARNYTADRRFDRVQGGYEHEFVSARDYFQNDLADMVSEKCDAGITVTLWFGDMPNVVKTMSTDIVDHVAISEDIEVFQAAGHAAIDDMKNSVSGSTDIPKL